MEARPGPGGRRLAVDPDHRQDTGKINPGEQTTLTSAIHAIEAALGTYNRMLQWWPSEL